MRILALDWGTVRIGAAISDPEGKIAFPLDKFIDSKNAIAEIKTIITEVQIEKILIGQPLGLENQITQSTTQAKKFISQLQGQIIQPIELLDERFSSVAAGKILSEQGMTEKNQRQIKDNMAAQLMLQTYLDTK